MGDLWGSLVSSVAALVAVVPVIYGVTSSTNRLGRAERISRLASEMQPSSERTLLENVRDQLAADWALLHWAPKHRARQVSAWTAWVAAVLSFTVFVLFAATNQPFGATWGAYGVGFAFMSLALLLKGSRDRSRTRWMATEREMRWIRPPISAA